MNALWPGSWRGPWARASWSAFAVPAAATDWRRILRLYDRLLDVSPSPVIELHRAVALAEVEGPKAALIAVDRLSLERSHVFHAIRADLLRRLGRDRDAANAYDDAIARAENAREREFLLRGRAALTAS